MRRPFVAGNWKMNTTEAEAVALARDVAAQTAGAPCDVAVCVPFPHLGGVRDALSGSHVRLGAQDVYWESKGAYTGEVSAAMLVSILRFSSSSSARFFSAAARRSRAACPFIRKRVSTQPSLPPFTRTWV